MPNIISKCILSPLTKASDGWGLFLPVSGIKDPAAYDGSVSREDAMNGYSKKDVLSYVREKNVRFVRLSFCDIFGQLKNVSISASELERAFDEGIRFDASAIRGFLNVEDSDLLLFPDPDTLAVLPWRPTEHGRVIRLFCSIKHPDMSPFEGDARYLLKNLEINLVKDGLKMLAGTECEFYLFSLDDNGNPTLNPMDRAGYLDVAPMDKGENLRREISLMLEEMGIYIETSHHEKGPGQNEVAFRPSTLLCAADDIITFKSALKMLAYRSGLFASFLPKPLFEESGSGFHISLSCHRDEKSFDAIKENMTAGILRRISEITVFLNPVANSYDRLGSFEAPGSVSWGTGNRGLLIRIPETQNESAKRIEVRSADPSCNPYLALLLLVSAAREGIETNARLEDIVERKLPENLKEAIDEASDSDFIKGILPSHLVECFLNAKRTDWKTASDSGYPKVTARDMEFQVT